MIRILDDMPAGVLDFEAEGKLTASDYTEVLAPALEAVSASGGKIRVVLLLPEGFGGMEAGALWQDLKVGIRDWNAWERIALVTDIGWMRDGLRIFAWAVPGESRAFAGRTTPRVCRLNRAMERSSHHRSRVSADRRNAGHRQRAARAPARRGERSCDASSSDRV